MNPLPQSSELILKRAEIQRPPAHLRPNQVTPHLKGAEIRRPGAWAFLLPSKRPSLLRAGLELPIGQTGTLCLGRAAVLSSANSA